MKSRKARETAEATADMKNGSLRYLDSLRMPYARMDPVDSPTFCVLCYAFKLLNTFEASRSIHKKVEAECLNDMTCGGPSLCHAEDRF